MILVAISETEQGPPPPPPPIYIDKTRGSKIVVGTELHLSFRYDPVVTLRCEQQGLVLWLRSALGSWHKGAVGPQRLADGETGYVRLAVEGLLDPRTVLIQPQHDDWAQVVDLGAYDAVSPALSAPLP